MILINVYYNYINIPRSDTHLSIRETSFTRKEVKNLRRSGDLGSRNYAISNVTPGKI